MRMRSRAIKARHSELTAIENAPSVLRKPPLERKVTLPIERFRAPNSGRSCRCALASYLLPSECGQVYSRTTNPVVRGQCACVALDGKLRL